MSNRNVELAGENRKSALSILGFVLAILSIASAGMRAKAEISLLDKWIFGLGCASFVFFWFAFFFVDLAWVEGSSVGENRFMRIYSSGIKFFRCGLLCLLGIPALMAFQFGMKETAIAYIAFFVIAISWYFVIHRR